MNYRSVVVFGTATVVDDSEKKFEVLHALTDHLIRGRSDEIRRPSTHELKRTLREPVERERKRNNSVTSGTGGIRALYRLNS
jgi:nitroimidazol reductase NimA-like FMN-containing flavoprotein (pyridoxamine 5'-phosphate oxidase superfamily)